MKLASRPLLVLLGRRRRRRGIRVLGLALGGKPALAPATGAVSLVVLGVVLTLPYRRSWLGGSFDKAPRNAEDGLLGADLRRLGRCLEFTLTKMGWPTARPREMGRRSLSEIGGHVGFGTVPSPTSGMSKPANPRGGKLLSTRASSRELCAGVHRRACRIYGGTRCRRRSRSPLLASPGTAPATSLAMVSPCATGLQRSAIHHHGGRGLWAGAGEEGLLRRQGQVHVG